MAQTMIARQQKWAYTRQEAGNCRICGKPRKHFAWLCDWHQSKVRDYERERRRQQREEHDDNQEL